MKLSYQDVKEICKQAGFKGLNLDAAVRIAYCESSFNPNAHNTNNEDSRGLFQINVSDNANPQYKNLDLFDPVINAEVAHEIFTRYGNNFQAWTCARQLNLTNPNEIIIISGLAIGLIFVLYLT